MLLTGIQNNLTKLADNGGIKIIGAIGLTGATQFFTSDFMIFFLYFIVLVVLDLLTKQLSLSAKYLARRKEVDESEITLLAKFLGIVPAFNAGVINSLYMRDKFTKKLLTYMLVVGSAFITDCMVCGSHQTDDFIFFKLAITYLATNELLSILENLRDSGNKQIGRLVTLIDSKLGKII